MSDETAGTQHLKAAELKEKNPKRVEAGRRIAERQRQEEIDRDKGLSAPRKKTRKNGQQKTTEIEDKAKNPKRVHIDEASKSELT